MNTDTIKNERIEWIDTAKLLAVYFVILGHRNIVKSTIGGVSAVNIIFAFHMPLFFFLSGLIDKRRTVFETVKKSSRNLLLPYACFYAVTYIWWFFASFLRHPELFDRNLVDSFIKPLHGFCYGVGFETEYSVNVDIPLWFLMALFWCRILNAAIQSAHRIIKIGASITCIILSIILWKTETFLPYSLGSASMAFPFYFVGNMISARKSIKMNVGILAKVFFIVIATILLIIAVYFNGRSDMNGIGYGKNPFLYWLGAFSGITLLCTFSQLLPKMISFFRFLSKNTLIIFALEGISSGIISKLFVAVVYHYHGNLADFEIPLLSSFIIALFSLLSLSLPCFIINKYFPFMIGKHRE